MSHACKRALHGMVVQEERIMACLGRVQGVECEGCRRRGVYGLDVQVPLRILLGIDGCVEI